MVAQLEKKNAAIENRTIFNFEFIGANIDNVGRLALHSFLKLFIRKAIFGSMKKLIFLLLLLLTTDAMAAFVAVLETGADGEAKSKVSASDRQFITNVLREEAVKQLPAVQNYTIMTRENILQMLPPGKAIEDCEGSCLVETGKNISADYVCQARVGSFAGDLTLSAELYETARNKLVASFNGSGADMKELLQLVRAKSPDFFRSVKGSGSFSGVSGIGDVIETESFSFSGKKKFIVELVTTPAGALPTIDGKGISKCLSTPCKVQVEEGNHRFVATLDRYDDAESVVDITTNNQKVELSLSPNFGWLVVKPKLAGAAAVRGKLDMVVDGLHVEGSKLELETGVHSVQLLHPCYDPVEFKVSIAKNKAEIFDKEIMRGKGGLELNAEYNGEPQAVAVYMDGLEVGSTPYVGEIPLCAEVSLKGNGWSEFVDVESKWHEVVKVTHQLKHSPEEVLLATDAMIESKRDSLETKVGESIPANVNDEPEKKAGIAGKVVLGIGVAATVTGVVLAVVGNSKAKDAAATDRFANEKEYDSAKDKAKSGQTLRGVGIALAIVSAVGVGVSFAF